ncbi:MAG: PfkB family carbohydrate kinase, partial [Acidimicrobiia bacterium]
QEQLMASTLIVTQGAQGSIWRIGSRAGATPAIPTQQLDRIGAGDAFAAGVIVGALDGDTELGIRLGTAMAALKLGWHGDQFRGTRPQVEEVLAGRGNGLDR